MLLAGPGLLVRLKLAGEPTPEAVALTLKLPAVVLAVKVGAVATPLALVETVGELAKVPEAPLAGAVNVTVTPDTGAKAASRTSAERAVPNAVATVVLCGVPEFVTMLAGGPSGIGWRRTFAAALAAANAKIAMGKT